MIYLSIKNAFCKDKGVNENVKRPIDGKPLGATTLKRLGRNE